MKCSQRNERGFSLIELLVVVSIILIVAGIAIPNLLQARLAANEASAVSSIRTINTAEISYISNYPTVGYAPTLASLGGTNCNPGDETSACLIDSLLSSGTKQGYTFTSTGIVAAPAASYLAVASPVAGSGNRSFCSTEEATINYDPSGAAIPDHDTCNTLTPLQ